MKKVNLNGLPLSELLRIQKEVPKAIIKAKKSEKKDIIKKMENLAAESGFDLSEIFSNKTPKAKRKVKPKYRNPYDSSILWTGRGRRPLWVERHLNEGGMMDDILI